jgi:hypothetical protein
MEILFIVVPVAIIVLVIFLLFISNSNKDFLVQIFKRNNIVVFGKKGSGKDLLFSMIINRRKQFYYSNIKYENKKHLPINVNDLTLFPNTYESLLNDKIEQIDPNLKEKVDIYISDGGVILPSQYDYLLDKKYPSLSIFYALQRHLYNSNTHVNTQYLGRLYKKIREQADGYVRCEKVIFIGFFYIQLFTYYDRYESAERTLLPMPNKLLNGHLDAIKAQYDATNGLIKPMFILGLKSSLKYDSRHFKHVFFKNLKDKNRR